jgi:hypothetical protein
MHVRTAHADAPHAQQHVALTGRGDRYLPKTEFAGGCAYDTFHLTHCCLPFRLIIGRYAALGIL